MAPKSRAVKIRQAKAHWLILAIGSVLVLAATYLAAVWTKQGQTFEDGALHGAKLMPAIDMTSASDELRIISVASLGLAIVVIGVTGAVRGGLKLAVAGAGTIVGSVLTTELLKKVVLPRPILVPTPEGIAHNSFPSGHTTIAMSIMVAALIVSSYRLRGWVMFFVMTWSTAIGAATIAAHWHRLSDTIGANCVALTWGALFSWWLASNKMVKRYSGSPKRLRTLYVAISTTAAFFSLTVGTVLATLNWSRNPHDTPDFFINCYEAVHALALAGALIAALVFWWSWRNLEFVRDKHVG